MVSGNVVGDAGLARAVHHLVFELLDVHDEVFNSEWQLTTQLVEHVG